MQRIWHFYYNHLPWIIPSLETIALRFWPNFSTENTFNKMFK